MIKNNNDFVSFLKNELKELKKMSPAKAKEVSKKALYDAGIIDKKGKNRIFVKESYISG